MTRNFRISPAGVELIASFEGFVNGVYNDGRDPKPGYATCGIGHLLHPSPATAADHRAYDGKGRAFFLDLLAKDIERVAMAPMRQYIHVPLNQHQVDALASLAFNCGGGALAGTIGRKLNAGDKKGAADAFRLWDNPSVLRPRRETERTLFLKPAKTVAFAWLTTTERRWVLEYDRLKKADKNPDRRRVLRRVMHAEAAKIAYAAKHAGGWDRQHRRQRYHSLLARTS